TKYAEFAPVPARYSELKYPPTIGTFNSGLAVAVWAKAMATKASQTKTDRFIDSSSLATYQFVSVRIAVQYAEAEITSPLSRVHSANSTLVAIPSERNRAEPSHNSTLAPRGWSLQISLFWERLIGLVTSKIFWPSIQVPCCGWPPARP